MEKNLTDKDIIANLGSARDCGGAGNCLYYSLEYVISNNPTLLARLPEPYRAQWPAGTKEQRSVLLRNLAMEEEASYLVGIQGKLDNGVKLTALDELRLLELYKDMCEEFHSKKVHCQGLSHDNLMKQIIANIADPSKRDERIQFVLNGFPLYSDFTRQVNNWSGSSELISIGVSLNNTSVRAFGLDKIAMPKVQLDENGKVLPYLSVETSNHESPSNRRNGNDPLSLDVFQCWGGGHYQAMNVK